MKTFQEIYKLDPEYTTGELERIKKVLLSRRERGEENISPASSVETAVAMMDLSYVQSGTRPGAALLLSAATLT